MRMSDRIRAAVYAAIDALDTPYLEYRASNKVPLTAHPSGTRDRQCADLRAYRRRRRTLAALEDARERLEIRVRAALRLYPTDIELADTARMWLGNPYPSYRPGTPHGDAVWRAERDALINGRR